MLFMNYFLVVFRLFVFLVDLIRTLGDLLFSFNNLFFFDLSNRLVI